MQQEDAHDDGAEAAQRADDVVRRHVLPLFEQDGRTSEDRRGEEDVVDGCHEGRVEDVQGPVQVIDLRAHAHHQAEQQGPGQRVPQHGPARHQLLDGDAQALNAGHRECPDHGADGDVHQDVRLSVAGTHHEDEDQGHDDHECREDHKTWRRRRQVQLVKCLHAYRKPRVQTKMLTRQEGGTVRP